MKACAGCGEWVGDANANCPRCGQPMAAPPAPAAQPAPGWTPPPPPGGMPPPVGTPPPRPPQSQWAPVTPPGWDPYAGGYAMPRKRKRIWPRVVLISGLILVIGIGGLIIVGLVFGNNPPPALDAYMDGKGVTYTTRDHQLQIRLAETPAIKERDAPVGGVTVREVDAVVSHKTYEQGVFEVHGLPSTLSTAQTRLALEGGMTGLAVASNWKVSGTTHTTFRGYEALRAQAIDDKDAHVEVVLFATRTGIYGLLAHTRHGTKDVLDEMEKSLQIFGVAP